MRRKYIKPVPAILAAICLASSLSGCKATINTVAENTVATAEQETEKENTEERTEDNPQEETSAKKNSVKKKKLKNKKNDDNDAARVFAEMSDWVFEFSSGAGGWATELYVNPDGTFSGNYHDSEMGATGPGYENGTIYECSFTGKFSDNVRSAGPLMHSLFIESIEYKDEPDTEEIIDNILYKYSTPYGLEGLEKQGDSDAPLVFMEAGAVTSAINSEEMDWISPMHFGNYIGADWEYFQDVPDELPYAVLINTTEDYAFYSENISAKNKTFLVNKVRIPGLTNIDLTVNDDGTYYCVDENDDKSFRVINTCFKVTKTYDSYNNAPELVNDSLKELYGRSAPSYNDIYITAPKDAYEMDYPRMAVNGEHSDYAFWYPNGDRSRICEGRFVEMSDFDSDNSYVYAYIIETGQSSDSYPDSGFANFYITSLTLTGKKDNISSADSEGKGAVRSILTEMMTPEGNEVLATEVLMVSESDTELVKKYHLEDADFDDDYEMVYPDNRLHQYGLAYGGETPFYVQYPEDKFHRLYPAYDLEDYMGETSNENTRLMKLYLNEDDEVVYAYEVYTP